jgi:hypothetical protein
LNVALGIRTNFANKFQKRKEPMNKELSMRALLSAAAVVVAGTVFVVGCGQSSSPTIAPVAPSTLTPAATTAESIRSGQDSGASLSAGWDVFNEKLDYTKSFVDWSQPGSTSNLLIKYHLVGARANWAYQVGVHVFDRCDSAFGQYLRIIPCSTPATRQNTSRNVEAFEFGAVSTDPSGNGAETFVVHRIASGNYELEFDVRANVGCPDSGSCDVVFQSPGPFGIGTIHISIP